MDLVRRLDYIIKNGTIFYDVSGGKDSVLASFIAHRVVSSRAKRLGVSPKEYILYIHTPLAFEENLDYIKRYGEFLSVEVIVARPEEGLEVLSRRGFPTTKRPWCRYRWKLDPMVKASIKHQLPHLHIMGIRKGESRRRMMLYSKHSIGIYYYCLKWISYCSFYWNPIIELDSNTRDMLIERFGIPKNPLWDKTRRKGSLHSSPDCAICILYATEKDYRMLRIRYPEIWEKVYDQFKKLNQTRRRKAKILANKYTDLDKIASQKTLLDFFS